MLQLKKKKLLSTCFISCKHFEKHSCAYALNSLQFLSEFLQSDLTIMTESHSSRGLKIQNEKILHAVAFLQPGTCGTISSTEKETISVS